LLVACEREAPKTDAQGSGAGAGTGAAAKSVAPISDEAKKIEIGKALHITAGCNTCHSVDGTKMQGPTMKGVFGSTVRLNDGATVVADEAYMKRSILDPMAEVVEGYPPQMLPYQGILSDEKIDALIAYYKSLSPAPSTATRASPATPAPATAPSAGH
jgi:cytochrome c2